MHCRMFFCVVTLVALAVSSGCKPKVSTTDDTTSSSSTASSSSSEKPAHSAHGAGLHGGTITDWGGGKYHVEFTVDH